MKIDGIELLEKMKNKEIKEGTRIECSRFGGNNIHIVYEENELKLYDRNGERYDKDKWTGVIAATDLLNYTFEIIEEDKEIKKLEVYQQITANGNEHNYINYNGSKYAISTPQRLIIENQNKLIKEVNKLKKEVQ